MKKDLRELSEALWAWNYVNPFFYATVILLVLYSLTRFIADEFWRHTGLRDYFKFKKYLKEWNPEACRQQYKRLHEDQWQGVIKPSKIRRYKRLMIRERYLRLSGLR